MIKRIKGMYDILPPQDARWREIEEQFIKTVTSFGFSEARTPLIERTELFSRSIGESTDIIEKEMYTLEDRRGRSLAMRPEGTASMVRAYIQNKIAQQDPIAKWFYKGPMYRYERPQKGRNRQFFQVGAEVFGIASAFQDAELIAMGSEFLKALGLTNIELQLNSLGDSDERKVYRQKLVDYLEGHTTVLCDDCLRRMQTNPLRTLDCKNEACIKVADNAPMLLDNLGTESKTHFELVLQGLDELEVKYSINKRIVRGLDYYNRTAFEYKAGALGSQDAVGGGGRYDGLVKSLGGQDTPAVGFALGLDRIVMLLEDRPLNENGLDFYLIPMGEAATNAGLKIAKSLRAEGLIGEIDFSGRRLKHLFQRAESKKSRYAIIIGDKELENGVVNLKNMTEKSQQEVLISELSREKLK